MLLRLTATDTDVLAAATSRSSRRRRQHVPRTRVRRRRIRVIATIDPVEVNAGCAVPEYPDRLSSDDPSLRSQGLALSSWD